MFAGRVAISTGTLRPVEHGVLVSPANATGLAGAEADALRRRPEVGAWAATEGWVGTAAVMSPFHGGVAADRGAPAVALCASGTPPGTPELRGPRGAAPADRAER